MDKGQFGDPDHSAPEGTDAPTVEAPTVSAGDIWHSKIARVFVLQVVIWNAALLVLSVGGLLIYFNNDWTTGSQLLGIGAVLILYSAYRWPRRDVGA